MVARVKSPPRNHSVQFRTGLASPARAAGETDRDRFRCDVGLKKTFVVKSLFSLRSSTLMGSAIHLALVKAEYAYTPQTEDELELEEDALYYLLDDADSEWHQVKPKTSPTSPDPPKTGLVPANYILPALVLRQAIALYAYEAQTDDELTIKENESLSLYEEDGDWSLVGRLTQDGSRGVGYVPTTYIDSAPESGTASRALSASLPEILEPRGLTTPNHLHSSAETRVVTWTVHDVDHKKKKCKGSLAIGNGVLIFSSEGDKLGVQQYPISTVSIAKTEKGKHIILQCGTDERHFQVSSKDLDDIISTIRRTQEEAFFSSAGSPSRAKLVPGSTMLTSRPPSAMANPSKTSGSQGRKVSFATPTGKPATALYDFEAQGEDELSVEEGDRLFVIDDTTDDDWWTCARQSDAQEGAVPASYIELDEGQPSGNPQAADAAKTAAAAENARKKRIQEEEDAKLAQQLAEEDDSELKMANARAAGRKVVAAREAEQRRAAEAEAAARRKRESEVRSTQRREAERAMSNPGFSSGPMPPKLTARPGSAQSINHHPASAPAPPRRPDSAPREGKSKPQGQIRTWRDRTGQFKVEAEFRGLQNGKIRLHKLNGVIIEVPLTKMSTEDVIWLEGATGRSLRVGDPDEMPLAKLSLSSTTALSNSGKSHSSASDNPKRPTGPAKKPTDWFEFFLNAGCDLDDCTRYATNFERDRIDESLLPELEAATMRNLGLREGDVIRVRKLIKQRFGDASTGKNTDPVAEQVKREEDLARSAQEQGPGTAPNIFTSGPNGSLKTTRRGRPAPPVAGSSAVDVTALKLVDDSSTSPVRPKSPPHVTLLGATNAAAPALQNGFDDDAWQVRPNSTTPVTPQPTNPPLAIGTTPSNSATSTSDPLPPATSEAPQTSLTDEIFQKIMNHSNQSGLTTGVSASTPPVLPPGSDPSAMAPQPTGFNPNGPRGPLAPVALNAPLLNPLVPTNSRMRGFVPTRPLLSAQPTGFIGQTTISQPNQMLPGQASSGPSLSPMMMQPTGMGMSFMPGGGGNMQSHQVGFIPSQPTGMGNMPGLQPQMTGFNAGFLNGPPPPVPSMPSTFMTSIMPAAPTTSKSFNPTDVFAQMKTGQFAHDGSSAPQNSDMYNALRAQPTGYVSSASSSGVPSAFAQQFMPRQPQTLPGLQTVQPQPTGFAPGGYIKSQPMSGLPTQHAMFPGQTQQQSQQSQWQGY